MSICWSHQFFKMINSLIHVLVFLFAGNVRERIDNSKFYFHLIAWVAPFVLTIMILALSEVDGSSMAGICFVGLRNQMMYIGFVLLPIAFLLLLNFIFVLFGMIRLNAVMKNTHNNKELIKLQSIKNNVITRCAFTSLVVIAWIILHFSEFNNAKIWDKSLYDMIL